jgi:hypothetical protein
LKVKKAKLDNKNKDYKRKRLPKKKVFLDILKININSKPYNPIYKEAQILKI